MRFHVPFAPEADANLAQLLGLVLLPVAILFLLFAAYTYWTRTKKILNRDYTEIASETAPLVLGACVPIACFSCSCC